jgi:arylsulfatase A-like enzyme
LVVYIVVDQLPLSLFEPVKPYLKAGFSRFTGDEGFLTTARYAHAVTYTGPGHATLSTGASPSVHGIVSNGWMEDGERVYCCATVKNMNAEALADRVKAAGGKVASVSLKDRGAILLAGSSPDALIYFDKKAGSFTGPDWAKADITAVLESEWQTRLPQALQALYPDEQDHEPADSWGTASFPHPPIGVENAAFFPYHPHAGTVVTDIAIEAIDQLDLGADDQPDLLTVSYSQTDYVGHMFSPQSREALDAMLVLDEDLQRLFVHLDTQVGADKWTAVLTADHGAAPGTARRIDQEAFNKAAQKAFNDAGFEGEIAFIEPTFNLPAAVSADPEKRARATQAIVDAIGDYDGIAGAWAWREEGGFPKDIPYRQSYIESVDNVRSGDVFVMIESGVLFTWKGASTGTSHGTPYDYDAVVPVMAYGKNIEPGTSEQVDVRQIAATVGALLGVGAPAQGMQEPIAAALK